MGGLAFPPSSLVLNAISPPLPSLDKSSEVRLIGDRVGGAKDFFHLRCEASASESHGWYQSKILVSSYELRLTRLGLSQQSARYLTLPNSAFSFRIVSALNFRALLLFFISVGVFIAHVSRHTAWSHKIPSYRQAVLPTG